MILILGAGGQLGQPVGPARGRPDPEPFGGQSPRGRRPDAAGSPGDDGDPA